MPPPRTRPPSLEDTIRKILAVRELSLSQISRASRSRAPANAFQRIPHNLYSALRMRSFSPNVFQVFELSVLTGYRFADWLEVFGFSLRDVARFQAEFPVLRTVELDASACQPGNALPWFKENQAPDFSAPLMPLGRWLALTAPAQIRTPTTENSGHRFAKIGSQDAFAFPELVPGSIVRVTAKRLSSTLPPFGGKCNKRLYLIAHGKGLICAQLTRSGVDKFVLCSRQLPYAQIEFQEARDAIVLGIADFEIRPLGKTEKPVVTPALGRFWTPTPLSRGADIAHVGEFVRRARLRSGLTFREASRRTRIIARKLGDRRYYCAAASLSDYETQRLPPRHIHKLISICAVYFASVAEFLAAAGINLDRSGTLAIPTELLGGLKDSNNSASESSRFFNEMQRRYGEPPYFLHDSLGALFGLPHLSARDVFWAGGLRGFIHPCLAGALFFVVDRKRKNPRAALSCPKWAQPVYVVQQRSGDYLCGFCTMQGDTLILRSCFASMPKPLRLRNRVDAEVVGKVVGVVRRLR
jgi:hypothetical protein